MSSADKTQPNIYTARLEQAIFQAKAGHKAEARDMLRQIVALQPVNQAAWLWLSAVASDKEEAVTALNQARQINPAHSALPKAEQWLARRFSNQSATKITPVQVSPQPSGRQPTTPQERGLKLFNSLGMGVVLIAIAIGIVVLFLGIFWEVNATAQIQKPQEIVQWVESPSVLAAPQPSALDNAWEAQDWPQVITILETQSQPGRQNDDHTQKLSQAYLQQGLILRQQNQIEPAQHYFEQAIRLTPEASQSLAGQELALASYYLAGKSHYQNGDWPEAITSLQMVYDEEPTYSNIKNLLFSATYNQGLAYHAAEDLGAAQKALRAAVALRPDLTEPRLQLAEIEYALKPETPAEMPVETNPIEDRIIVVGIAEQRMAVFEGDQQVYDFIVSTGEPGRETAIGEFEILNKIDVAYASTWNLDMPYWMGIYWAGHLQNGIHSLPTVKHTGQTLWDGYLGQRVSYGCVILGHDDAATLYDWADVGVTVKIVPSLANWSAANNN